MPTQRFPALALLAAAACNPAAPSPAPATTAPSASALPPPTAAASVAPPTRPAATPAEAAVLLAQADRCLADPACDLPAADALYRAADDAGAAVSCFRFYHGIGVGRDLPRARACFARQIAATGDCHGSSPSLQHAYLATMLVDGQGGPAEPEQVKGVFAGCYRDITVQALEEEAAHRTLPSPLDFCDKIGGTTLTIAECQMIAAMQVEDRKRRVQREVIGKLDAEGQKLAATAEAAWTAFAAKQAEAMAEAYQGTLHTSVQASRRNALEERRVKALLALPAYAPEAGADPVEAEKQLDEAFRALTVEAPQKALLTAARRAFAGYRKAEIALYAHAGRAAKREVERDVGARLTRAYREDVEAAGRP